MKSGLGGGLALPLWLRLRCAVLLFACLAPRSVSSQANDPDRTHLIVEALSRLDPAQVNSNPQLKSALDQALDGTRGTPKFVELVRQFQIKGRDPELLELVLKFSDDSAAADALRLILENQNSGLVRDTLIGTNVAAATKIAETLGNVGGHQIVPLLEPLVVDSQRDSSLRKQAVRALAKTQEGASFLLQLAKENRLSAAVKLAASIELNQARWPGVKAEAVQILPRPQMWNAESLPPIATLVGMKGDASRGAEVFTRPDVACINCHQVNGKGLDVGPKLSEVGTKLAKEALFEAILDPSAGISFGYEAWQIDFKNGDEAYGLIVSETADELAVKTQAGITTPYKKNEIAKRHKASTSIMPAGLQQAMSLQDLVDVVEYLASLKKPAN